MSFLKPLSILIVFVMIGMTTNAQIDESFHYKILSATTNKAAAANNNLLVLRNISNAPTLQWTFEKVDGEYGKLINDGLNKVVSYETEGKKLGFLHLTAYKNKDYQLRRIVNEKDGEVSIRSKFNGWAIDIMDDKTAQGSFLIAYDYHGEGNQRWKVQRDSSGRYQFTSVSAGQALGISPQQNTNGAILAQWSASDITTKWKFKPTSDGYYCILDADSGLALQTSNQQVNNDLAVELWDFDGSRAQKCFLEELEGGEVMILTFSKDKALDLMLKKTMEGVPVIAYPVNESKNQQWLLEPLR